MKRKYQQNEIHKGKKEQAYGSLYGTTLVHDIRLMLNHANHRNYLVERFKTC
jgi:hypothetical protein